MARKRTARRGSLSENLTLCDSAGRPRIILGYLGPDELPTLQMSDASERPRAAIQVGPQGQAGFCLHAANGSPLVGMSANEEGEIAISVNRPPGIPVLSVRWSAENGLQIDVLEQPGRPTQYRVVPTE